MSRTAKTTFILLGAASTLGLAWLLRKQRGQITGLDAWRGALTRQLGEEKAGQLTEAVRQQSAALIAETPMPRNPALRWHLRENILPGLALYRVLLQQHDGDQAAALADVDEAFRAKSLAFRRLQLAPLKVLPAPFRLFRLVLPQTMKQFPVEGWDIAYVENSDEKVAFNITRCFYLNTLTSLGAPELTASFCKTDDVMAECFPPAIQFVRPHTLGRGDATCDFQYCHVQ